MIMVIRSRLPKEKTRGMGSKVIDGLGKLGQAYWDAIPVEREGSLENVPKRASETVD